MNFTHHWIQPSSLNSFVFCKRKWYYRDILKMNITNENMKIGRYINDNHWQKTKKRKEKTFYSQKYYVKGRIDYILNENGKHIPLEIKKGKSDKGDIWKWDAMQLICYIKMLDEFYPERIRFGYVLYKASKEKLKLQVSKENNRNWISYLKQIRSYMRTRKIPKRKKHQFGCGNCALGIYCLL